MSIQEQQQKRIETAVDHVVHIEVIVSGFVSTFIGIHQRNGKTTMFVQPEDPYGNISSIMYDDIFPFSGNYEEPNLVEVSKVLRRTIREVPNYSLEQICSDVHAPTPDPEDPDTDRTLRATLYDAEKNVSLRLAQRAHCPADVVAFVDRFAIELDHFAFTKEVSF